VLEHCDRGSLRSARAAAQSGPFWTADGGGACGPDARAVAAALLDAARGLEFLHAMGIAHRDVKVGLLAGGLHRARMTERGTHCRLVGTTVGLSYSTGNAASGMSVVGTSPGLFNLPAARVSPSPSTSTPPQLDNLLLKSDASRPWGFTCKVRGPLPATHPVDAACARCCLCANGHTNSLPLVGCP
jgi:serine/threonine protein kinase